MRITQLFEANVAAKIKDPKTIKQIRIAMSHDSTLPRAAVARLGPKPDDQSILALWSTLLDKSLSNTQYGDISQDGKFDEWLTRLYINGQIDYEDMNGEGGDALGAWKALSIRGRLKEKDQDFNKFKSLRQIQRITNDREYRDELRRIQDSETIEKHKREKKEITILDNERFLVTVPMNYGACYTFNNSHGFRASFCTGSSSGLTWFNRYADDGPIVSIFDKEHADDVNGKWQMHAPTDQLNNGDQSISRSRGDAKFAELFPGLLKEIVKALKAHGAEIKANSEDIVKGGYDIDKAAKDIEQKFPLSYASGKEPEPEPEEEPGQERAYLVTLISTGRQARVQATSEQDAVQRVIARHPTITPDQLRVDGLAPQEV
jgi:hypothetical protein